MKQEERRFRSRAGIIQSGLNAFGQYGYNGTGIEQICLEYSISKGMMYHYFCSKDNLFLACAEKFLQDLLKYLSENIPLCSDGTPAQQLQKYFLCCEKYFRLHPESRRLYANLIISPPKHLKESIEELRKPLRIINSTFLQNVTSHLSLYDNLRTEETLSYLSNVERFFWNIIEQYQANETELEWDSFLSITEQISEMMLFGVASKV